MKESAANKAAADALAKRFGGVYYKHADRFAKGRPDCTFSWNGRTSWLEFKMLRGAQSVHDELDKSQLVELIRLERAGCSSWVIAYREHRGQSLEIYRPTALYPWPTVPVAREDSLVENILRDLRVYGIVRFGGFHHGAVTELIAQAHG